MHAASRESLRAVSRRFDEIVGGLDSADLSGFADELVSVAALLRGEALLRKHIAGGAEDDSAPRVALVESLFGAKVGAATLDVLKAVAGARWSTSRDVTQVLERFANLAVLIDAERAGRIENVEDELFRFGRILDANPKLSTYLSDRTADTDGRIALLGTVLADKASSYTERLVTQTIRLLGGRSLDAVVPDLAELAASRRGESVAHVTAASELSGAQLERLQQVLTRIYSRKMSVQVDIDPAVLGGLSITVGDEVVDGTIATKLANAASQLPR